MAHSVLVHMEINPPPLGILSYHLELDCFRKKQIDTWWVKLDQTFERLLLPEYISNGIFTMPDGIANIFQSFFESFSLESASPLKFMKDCLKKCGRETFKNMLKS